MSVTLGALLRAARARRGWDQAQLARELGDVGQQTVSRWERGSSRPRRSMIFKIASLLDIDGQELQSAAGYSAPAGSKTVNLPVRPLTAELPLDGMAEDIFEHFSTDLAALLYPHAEVHGWGSRGHKQDGIDIEIRHPEGKPTGIQCKRMARFGPAEIQKAVAALTLDVRECIIYLTRIASPAARQEIAKHPDWRLWDRVDLSRAVRSLSDQGAAVRLVDTYFPGHREDFLGIAKPGPWETTEEFFRPFTGASVFSHEWSLTGRTRELGSLLSCLENPAARLALLVGTGGMGKTRLLRQVALDVAEDEGVAVRFVAADTAVEPAQFELLPVAGRLVIIIDDAHSRSDVAAIVKGVLRTRPHAQFVVAVRPYALSELTSKLRGVGILVDDCPIVRLRDLTLGEARVLAREILGADATVALVEAVGGLAPDCPLIMVIAATLIRRGALDPVRLSASPRIRSEVMQKFAEAMTAGSTMGDPDMRREVLDAVAALQPFRIDDDVFRAAIASLTGRSFDRIMPYLSGLEKAGVLLQRGTALRIVPDLLGDAILSGACVDTVSGVPLGYLERVYEAADGPALANLFVNACRVDWQINQDQQAKRSLVEPLWRQIEVQFADGDIGGRVARLRLLGKVAAFQPQHTLALIERAVGSCSNEDDGEPGHRVAAADGVSRYRQILDELPPLLESVACHLEYLAPAAELLWRLAADDARQTNQYPNHPIRVLCRLMEYSPMTPRQFHEELLAVAERWLSEPEPEDALHSPFDILELLLATEATNHISDGRSLTITTYPVTLDAVRDLRERVVDLVFAELGSADPKRAVRAAHALSEGLIYPGHLPRPVPDEEEDGGWTAAFVGVLDRIAAIGADPGLSPVVAIALREAMSWHYQYSTTATQAAAQAAWSSLPTSIEHRLALVLHDPWGMLVRIDESVSGDELADTASRDQLKAAYFDTVIADATAAWPDDPLLVDHLERTLLAERRAFDRDSQHGSPFVWALTAKRPSIAEELCRRVVQNPESVFTGLVPTALGRLLETDPAGGIACAWELVTTRNVMVARCVGHSFGWGRGNRAGLVDGEVDLVRSLLGHEDPYVRKLTLGACRAISQIQPGLAAELITSVRFADSPDVAGEVAGVFGSHGSLRWADLSDEQAEGLLAQLQACPSVDQYNIAVLLEEISKSRPVAVVDLLIQRVEAWERKDSDVGYDPIPRIWNKRPRFASHAEYGELLRVVLRWVASGLESWKRRYIAPELFALVTTEFDQETIAVLREALQSDDSRLVIAAGVVLGKAPRTFVWDQVGFVCDALHAAQRHGDDYVQEVEGGLHRAAVGGLSWGTPGQPFSGDVKQRDRAEAVLAQVPRGSEAAFYRSLFESAERWIHTKDEIDDRMIDRRDW